jgi:hypothetical protein
VDAITPRGSARQAQPWPLWLWVLAVAAGAAVVLARQGGAGALDTLWAEDGAIFLQQAIDLGFLEGLTRTYAGYLHLAPRLLAEAVSWLPIAWWATGCAVSGALGAALVALLVYRWSGAHVESPPLRAGLALAVLLVPIAGIEIINTPTNAHSYLLFAAFWAVLARHERRADLAVASGVLALATLSDPFAFVLLPIALARAVAHARRDDLVLFTVLLASVSAHGLAILLDPSAGARPMGSEVGVLELMRWYGSQVISGAFSGLLRARLAGRSPLLLDLAGFVLLAATLGAAWHRRLANVPFVALCTLMSIVLFAAPAWLAGMNSPRYPFVPVLLLLSAYAHVVGRLLGSSPGGRVKVLCLVGMGMILLSWATGFRVANLRGEGPSWSSEIRLARARCASRSTERVELALTPRLPEGMRLADWIGKPAWTLEVECRRF